MINPVQCVCVWEREIGGREGDVVNVQRMTNDAYTIMRSSRKAISVGIGLSDTNGEFCPFFLFPRGKILWAAEIFVSYSPTVSKRRHTSTAICFFSDIVHL